MSSMTITTTNPATGSTLATYPTMGESELDAALSQAETAQHRWARVDLADRARVLTAAAGILRERSTTLAALVTNEMGKPLRESAAEVEKCAGGCEFYAEHAEAFLATEMVQTTADRSWVTYEPLGVVLAVMPWNFPLWQVFRFAAPALMAGNAALLKHAPNTTGCALAVEDVLREAGLPNGLFRALLVAPDDVPATTERIIADPRIGAVTVTGSERAGAAVGAAAGRAVKRSVLELGGSDPFVVLADADLPRVAPLAARSRFLNAGQSCIAAKRFVVEAPAAERFTQLFVQAVTALSVGDPHDPETDIGPMAREDLRAGVQAQIRASVEAGATVLTGGAVVDGPGWYLEPTVLGDVRPGMPAYDAEVFGPVAAIIVAADQDDAVPHRQRHSFRPRCQRVDRRPAPR